MAGIMNEGGAEQYRCCAFTGHRIIEFGHRATIEDLVSRAIEYVYAHGARDFYNGGAIGFDMLSARQVIRFRMRHPDVMLHMLLPCRDQQARWSEAQRQMYEFILCNADTVEYLSDAYYRGCMQVRNQRLVENADVLVCYVGSDTGGSAYTLGLARRRGLAVYNLYPTLAAEC